MPDTATVACVAGGDVELGRAIRDARERVKVKQPRLAKLLGVSQTNMSKIELGQVAVTSLRLRQIAEVLGVTVGTLMGETGDVPLRDRLAHAPELEPDHRAQIVGQYDWLVERSRDARELVDGSGER